MAFMIVRARYQLWRRFGRVAPATGSEATFSSFPSSTAFHRTHYVRPVVYPDSPFKGPEVCSKPAVL